MPVILGAPRSGTTLLRFMLDAQPALAIPPETGFLALADKFEITGDALRTEFFQAITSFPPGTPAWNDFGIHPEQFRQQLLAIEPFSVPEGYRAFYRMYAARFKKSRWGDKTPVHCMHIATIMSALPEVHFIHIIRDGRDVAMSLRNQWFSPGDSIEVLSGYWRDCVTTARRQAALCPHYIEVHYEDLIRDPETVLRKICGLIGLEYYSAMLNYHANASARLAEHGDRMTADGQLFRSREQRLRAQLLTMQPPRTDRIQAWKQSMPRDEQERFERISGELLHELGYEVSFSGPASDV